MSHLMVSSVHHHNTRNSHNLFYNHVSRGEVKGAGIQTYNKLPNFLKAIKDLSVFKVKLKKYLLERECYSYAEFIE